MLTRLPGQILVASHNGQHWSGLNFEDICSKGMILLFGDNFCTFSNVKMSIVPLIKNVCSKIFGVRHQTSDRGGRVWDKCRHGNGWPRWMPPHPLLNAPSSPLGCAPLLALAPKQLNFMQIQPPPLGINPLLWAQSANIYIFILNNTVSTSFGPKTKDL